MAHYLIFNYGSGASTRKEKEIIARVNMPDPEKTIR